MLKNFRKKVALLIAPDMRIELAQAEENVQTAHMKAVAGIDAKNIMRQLLNSVTIDMEAKEDLLADLRPEQLREFYSWGAGVSQSTWWPFMRRWLLNSQGAKTLKELMSGRIDTQQFGSGTLNGIILVDDELSRLNSLFESSRLPQEVFEPQNIIQE